MEILEYAMLWYLGKDCRVDEMRDCARNMRDDDSKELLCAVQSCLEFTRSAGDSGKLPRRSVFPHCLQSQPGNFAGVERGQYGRFKVMESIPQEYLNFLIHEKLSI